MFMAQGLKEFVMIMDNADEARADWGSRGGRGREQSVGKGCTSKQMQIYTAFVVTTAAEYQPMYTTLVLQFQWVMWQCGDSHVK